VCHITGSGIFANVDVVVSSHGHEGTGKSRARRCCAFFLVGYKPPGLRLKFVSNGNGSLYSSMTKLHRTGDKDIMCTSIFVLMEGSGVVITT